ncbi:MAG: DNA adenine methylase [Acidobacteria bacterium]|nr:DNA adenine methylase [Acidobacteriota bacterium]
MKRALQMHRQVRLFDDASGKAIAGIHDSLWEGCFNARESSIHQLAPYVGKMKSGMARVLIEEFTGEGEVVLDPFCGSGVVPYEALLAGRHAIANDLNPYAYALTKGKLFAPPTQAEAVARALKAMQEAADETILLDEVPDWVRLFFHPKTLEETVVLSRVLRKKREYFLLSCLLGILHHVRPGFLSYPASHLVPYLRKKKYPPEVFPDMYRYRAVRPRLLAKIARAYRRFERPNPRLRRIVLRENALSMSLEGGSVDAIVSSPPYFGALDYGRDNRLRLWFLGIENYRTLEEKLTSNERVYVPQMTRAVGEMLRLLKPGKCAILVLGDYRRNGQSKDSAAAIEQLVQETYSSQARAERLLVDEVPDERRSRRRTRTTLQETVLVIRKAT